MNWIRMVLDGIMMAAYFNLFATAVAIYNPRLMFPCYPPSIIKDAPEPPTKAEKRFIIPGTEGHPGYEFKAWMKSHVLPEHLLQWPLLLCPVMALLQAGLGVLLMRL